MPYASFLKITLFGCLLLQLSACGQTGALFLPEQNKPINASTTHSNEALPA